MSAKIICFGSAKGGSGKTVTTTSIGVFLAALGKRVLLVDTDAATNGLTLLHLQEVLAHAARLTGTGIEPAGVYDSNEIANSAVEFVELNSGVHLSPATYHFIDTELQSLENYRASLRRILESARRDYDYILVDAQAGSDSFAQYAMSREVSDLVVLVSEYDPMSAAGIERLKGLMSQELTYVRTWILLNKMLPEFAENFGEFLEVARYLNPIPWDADVVRAYARRRLPLDLENGNTYTLAVMQTTRSLLGDEIAKSISEWTELRAEAIRRPIDLQYQDLEQELGSIILRSTVRHGPSEWLFKNSWTAPLIAAMLIIYSLYTIIEIVKVPDVWVKIGSAVVTALAIFLALSLRDSRDRSVSGDLEKAKLERRRTVIEEQLRELEVLRAADPEMLLRDNKRLRSLNTRRKR